MKMRRKQFIKREKNPENATMRGGKARQSRQFAPEELEYSVEEEKSGKFRRAEPEKSGEKPVSL